MWLISLKYKDFRKTRWARLFTRKFCRLIAFQFGYKVVFEDPHGIFHTELINDQFIIMPNHTSYIDILIIFQAFDGKINFKFVSKLSVLKSKFIKFLVLLNDPFFVDRNSLKSRIQTIKKIINTFKSTKESLVIFPEGTRNKKTGIGPLNENTFVIARKAKADILPITFVGNKECLDWKISKKTTAKIIIHKPILYSEYNTGVNEDVMSLVKETMEKPLNQTRSNK